MKPISLRALVAAIGLFVAIVTAISLPAGYLFVEYSASGNNLAFKAHLKANRLAKYIYSYEALWQYQSVVLAELIEVPEADERNEQQRIFGGAGKLVLETGAAPAYPTMTRAAAIVVGGAAVGRIEVSASARPLVIDTSIVAGLSGLIGFVMFFAVQVFPRRVLIRTLGALESSQHNLQVQNSRFDAALNNMSQGLIMFDAAERLVVCNNQYIELYDLSPDIVKPGCTLNELFDHHVERGHLLGDPDRYRADLLAKLSRGVRVDIIEQAIDDREISITYQPMPNGGWVVTHEDITERRKAAAKISHMALHDALTNLPNRLLLREQMENRLAYLSRDQSFAVLCLDLDRFKTVNDTLGHPFGDELLRQVAHRMSGCLRQGDTIARMGGDEFAILQGSIKQPYDAIALAQRLIEAASAPFDLDGHDEVSLRPVRSDRAWCKRSSTTRLASAKEAGV